MKYEIIGVKPIPGTKLYYTTQDYLNPFDDEIIERGYVTDLASIPKLAWITAGHPAATGILTASVVHDYNRNMYNNLREANRAKLKLIDLLFEDMLVDHGYGKFKSRIARHSVQFDLLFGKLSKFPFFVQSDLEAYISNPFSSDTKVIREIPLQLLKRISYKYG